MKSVQYSNGVTLSWDDNIKVGDIITTYHSGFHKLEEIHERINSTPLFEYSLFAKANGTLKTGKNKILKACCSSYCRLAKPTIKLDIVKLRDQIADLEHLKTLL